MIGPFNSRNCGISAAILVLALVAAGPRGSGAEESTADSEAQRLVDASIAFHGGDLYTASQTSMKVVSKSGAFEIDVRMDGSLFDFTAAGRAGGKLRRVRVTNDSVERWEDGVAVELDEVAVSKSRDWVMARIYFPFLPYRLNDPSVRKEDRGLEIWDGRELRKIKITFEAGTSTDADDEYLYWFDPESGRLEQLAYSFHTGDGGLRFRRSRNYRRVGGILFADQDNFGVDGSTFDVDQIEPAFVADRMRLVSSIALEDIRVRSPEE